MIESTTVVLGGGGVWGVAWMTGLIRGIAETGVVLGEAEAFIGTSAGSVVSTQLASGMAIDDLFERQIDPKRQPKNRHPKLETSPDLAICFGNRRKTLSQERVKLVPSRWRRGRLIMHNAASILKIAWVCPLALGPQSP